MRFGTLLVLALLFALPVHAAPAACAGAADLAPSAGPELFAAPTAAVAAADAAEPLFASAGACCSPQEMNACEDYCVRRNCLAHYECRLPQAECHCMCLCMAD